MTHITGLETGLEAIERKLLSLSRSDEIKQILRLKAEKLLQEVENNINALPITNEKKAELRASLTLEAAPDGLSWTLSSDSKYGEILENGTQTFMEMPWLRPAIITS